MLTTSSEILDFLSSISLSSQVTLGVCKLCIKGQVVNSLDSVGCMISVAVSRLSHCNVKASIANT